MTPNAFLVRLRYAIRQSRLAQIGLIIAIWMAGEAIVRLAALPIPGSIVGLAIALLLLASHRVSVFTLRRGAEWFVAEMLLFFVPAVLAVADHREFLGLLGLKLLLIIAAGTVTVMGATALTVDLCHRWRMRDGSLDRPS